MHLFGLREEARAPTQGLNSNPVHFGFVHHDQFAFHRLAQGRFNMWSGGAE